MSDTTRAPDRERRAFLFGRGRADPSPVRPPWTDEARIADRCTRCEACVDACPEDIVHMGEGGVPEVDFRRGECTFCGACANACADNVFDVALAPAWRLHVAISEGRCLAHAGIHCEACRDSCPTAAIRFKPRLGGPPTPSIEPERCTGCGACVAVCPVEAIAIQPTESSG